MRDLFRRPLRWVARYAASSYVAGVEATDAISVASHLAREGLRTTIGPWDGPGDAPEAVASSYEETLRAIGEAKLDCYLSVKVPSLDYNTALLDRSIGIARDHGIRVHFDSLSSETATPSLNLLELMLRDYTNLSCTLPSRWQRSIDDAERVIQLGVPVRLIKGQWADPKNPHINANESFLRLVDILAGRASQVAIATHDSLLARKALGALRRLGTTVELEQLYGLPIREAVAESLETPVRVYVPYGHAYLSYSLSAMKKRPVITWWLLRDFLLGVRKKISKRREMER